MNVQELDVQDLIDQPYATRQLITFVDDDKLREYQDDAVDNLESLSKEAVNIAMVAAAAEAVRSSSTSILSANPAVVLVGAWGFLKSWEHDRKSREHDRRSREHDIPFLAVPFSWASELQIPPGHPRESALYAAHPSIPDSYLPVSEFHRLTFEDKFTEALRILMYLGASEIDVKHERGWGRDFAAEIDAGIPGASGDASVEVDSDSNREALYHAELAGHDEPELPDDLVWLPYESTWQALVEGRMEFELEEFSLTLQYTDDYDINADLAVDAENAGFSLGGSFEKHQSTVWKIEGTFSS